MRRQVWFIVVFALFLLLFTGDPAAGGSSASTHASASANLAPGSGWLGGEFQISTTPGADRPAAAYNSKHDEYLVVWCASGNLLHGQRVSRSGARVGSAFSITGGHCDPAVAYNAQNDQYLVVWSTDVPNGTGEVKVMGRIISWDGSPVGSAAFLIWYWPDRRLSEPRVAWNSVRNEYFVIWNATVPSTYVPTDVSGTYVSAGGIPESVAHHLVDWTAPSVTAYSPEADITYNPSTNVYYLVWRQRLNYPSPYMEKGVYGARVDADGAFNYPVVPLAIEYDAYAPAVSTNQADRYFAVWVDVDHSVNKSRLRGAQINTAGGQEGGWFVISPWVDLMYQGPPAVAAPPGNRDEFLVVWQTPTSLGNAIQASHCLLDDPYKPLCDTFVVGRSTAWNQNFISVPAVAVAGQGYLIAYPEGLTTGGQNIYGRLWWAPAAFLPLIRK